MSEPRPIACNLEAAEYAERLRWLSQLWTWGVVGQWRTDLSLELLFRADAADQVNQMVHQEQACCGFLDFSVRREPAGVRVVITAPESAREHADALFAPFQHAR